MKTCLSSTGLIPIVFRNALIIFLLLIIVNHPASATEVPYWSQDGNDSEGTGRISYYLPEDVKFKWILEGREKGEASKGQLNFVATAPVIDSNGNIIFARSDGIVSAVTPERAQLWSFSLPDRYTLMDDETLGPYDPGGFWDFNIGQSPALDNAGNVYVASSGANMRKMLYSLDRTGKLRWTVELDGIPSKIRIAPSGRIILSTTKSLFSIRSDGIDLRSASISGTDLSHPIVAEDGSIYIGTQVGLEAYDKYLERKWILPIQRGLPFCNPAMDPQRKIIYFHANNEKALYAINTNGSVVWKSQTNLWSEASAAIAKDGTIYIGLTDINLSEQDISSCKSRVISDGYMAAYTPEGERSWLYAIPGITISSDDGDCFDNSRASDSGPLVAPDGAIVFGTDAQWVISLNADGSERWKFSYDENRGSSRMIREVDTRPVMGKYGTLYFTPLGDIGGIIAINSKSSTYQPTAFKLTRGNGQKSGILVTGKEQPPSVAGGDRSIPKKFSEIGQAIHDEQLCHFGNESGVTCPTFEQCSTREYFDGCCIMGRCLAQSDITPETERTIKLNGRSCNIGNESGVTCPSLERCSSGEYFNGCCIMGVCE